MDKKDKKEPIIEYKHDERLNSIEEAANNIMGQMILKSPKIYAVELPAFLDFFFSDEPQPMVVRSKTIGLIPVDEFGVESVVKIFRDFLRGLEKDPDVLGVYLYQGCKIQPDLLSHRYTVNCRYTVRKKPNESDRNLPPVR